MPTTTPSASASLPTRPAPVPSTPSGAHTSTAVGTCTRHLAWWVVSPLYGAVLLLVLVGLAVLAGFIAHFSVDTSPSTANSAITLRSTVNGRISPRIEVVSQSNYFTCVNPQSSGGTQMASATRSVLCESGPLVVGSLRRASSAAQARAAAEESGYEIPANYVAEPANNAPGWVFRAPGTSGNADIVRVAEGNTQNPTGYVRYYNSGGQPLNWVGKPGPDDETHLPLRSDTGSTQDPLGDDFFDLGVPGPLGGIIYE
jgi:hypothetical protein